MKISEAIRRGAARGPQIFGKTQDGWGGSCAMGSYYLGGGHIGSLATLRGQCPEDCFMMPERGSYYLESVIVHLNDIHNWTREAIADWVEKVYETPVEAPLEKRIPASEVMAFIGEPVKTKELVRVR